MYENGGSEQCARCGQIQDCNEKVKELEGENKQLSQSLDEAKGRDREQPQMANALTDEAETLKTIVSVLQGRCSEAETEAKPSSENSCTSSLDIKDKVIEKLRKELQGCHSTLTHLKLQNDELCSKLWSMTSKLSVASTGQQTPNTEGGVAQLAKELETKKSSLAKAENDLAKEREEKHTLQEELKRCKKTLDEYSESQLSLMEQAAELTDELQEVHVFLDRVDSQLTDKTNEGSELELELHIWKSTAERLKIQFEESQALRRKLEVSLLQAHATELPNRHKKENGPRISNLEQQTVSLNRDDMVKEENDKDEIEKASTWSLIVGDDQQEQEVLAGELQEAILAHIMKERNYTQLPIVLELMRSELSEAGSDRQIKEIERSVAHLTGQMERVSSAKAQIDLVKEYEEKQALEEELNRYKEMLNESTECQFTLIEQAADNERQLIDELQEAQVVLERVDSELTDKTIERSELEFELQVWKLSAERLQMQLEESLTTRRRLEASLLAQTRVEEFPKQAMENKDLSKCNLKQQNVLFNQKKMVQEQNNKNQIKDASKLAQIVDGEQREQELLAKDLEEAILAHIMKERNYTQEPLTLSPGISEFFKAGSNEKSKEKEGSVTYLMKQLEMKNDHLLKLQADLEKECEEKRTVKEELNRYKEMLDESSNSQLNAMQQAAEMETKLTDELLEMHDVLERVDSELVDKTIDRSELEFELQVWKSIAERLNVQVEESQAIRKKLEASLLAQADIQRMPKQETNEHENNQRMSNIKQQIVDNEHNEQELLARELEQAILAHIMKERNYT